MTPGVTVRQNKVLVWADLLIYYGVLMFCATIPFSISLATGGLFGSAFGWILRCALQRKIHWNPSGLDRVVVVFLLIQAATVIFSMDVPRSLHQLRACWHVLPFFLLIQGNFTEKRIERALNILIAAGVLAALLGILQYVLHYFQVQVAERSVVRVAGTFGMYMTYAGILALIWALALNQCVRPGVGKEKRILYYLAFAVILIALPLTHTRMALLAVAGAGAIFVALRLPRVFFAVVVLIVSAVALFPAARHAAQNIVWGDQIVTMDTNRMIPWADQRPFLWKGAYRIIKDRPWTGVGLANFRLAYKQYLPYELQKTYHHAHNNFLQLGAETGLPGLAAFIVLNVAILMFLLRSYFSTSREVRHAWVGGVLCAFVGFHVAGLFEYNFGDSEIAMLFWFLLGLAVATMQPLRQTEGVRRR